MSNTLSMGRQPESTQPVCIDCGHPTTYRRPICPACRKRRRYHAKRATCHPTRKVFSKGLCRECYEASGEAVMATCHPDRIAAGRGLCLYCYRDDPEVKALARETRRLRMYGLTHESYQALLTAQNNVCAICRETPGRKGFVIDHDHVTGAVRGILCTTCNTGIGHLKDSSKLLEKAANYMRHHEARRGIFG